MSVELVIMLLMLCIECVSLGLNIGRKNNKE